MNEGDYNVPPLRWAEIGEIAETVRLEFDLQAKPYFPIIDFLEKVLYLRMEVMRFEVVPEKEMKGAEGHTCPKGEFVALREDVYEAAYDGDGRARFTAAHELGHLVMHANRPLKRAEIGDGTPVYRRAEPQANQFAAALLMPAKFVDGAGDSDILMERHGVSRQAARNRLDYLQKKGGGFRVRRSRRAPGPPIGCCIVREGLDDAEPSRH